MNNLNIQSPRTDDAALEAEIAEKARAPRVALADVEASILSEHYFTALQGARMAALDYMAAGNWEVVGPDGPQPHRPELGLLTFCVLVLKNGFTVTGVSACASPENFDAEIGCKVARTNAVNNIWPLLGFRLRDELQRSAAV
ncbi:MAG: hypothetical protein IAE86_22670 [Burkholderiaceae bacterium]|nr:hypothetical protein [Burkholderiaceae bacterium]